MTNITRLQLRRGLAADWTLRNEVLRQAEPGFEIDTGKIKYGDGTTPWNTLPYATGGGGGISISETKPSDPGDGDLWFDSETGDIFIYYEDGTSSQWVQTVSGLSGGTDLRSRLGALESRTTDEEALNITQNGRLAAIEAYAQQSYNDIINGAFDIWQRGTSFSQAAAYTADRWVQATDKTATLSRQAFTPGAAPVAGYEGQFFLRHAVSAGGSFQVVQQRIEDVRTFAGETVTLSYWAKADAAVNNVVIIEQNFGTGGSTAVATSPVTHALTTSWARYTATFSVPSIAGKTIGTNSFLEVRVIRTIDALAHTIDLWGVQLEAGSIATPFRRNAPSIQAELAACQRYYYRKNAETAFGDFGSGFLYSSTGALAFMQYPVPMRIAPTSAETTGTAANYRVMAVVATAATAVPTLDTARSTSTHATILVNVGANTQGQGIILEAANTAGAFLGFSAEL
jgi:hypothetical protein